MKQPFAARDLVSFGALLGLALLVMRASWVGFMGSDDAAYLCGAEGWLEHGLYVGTNHWEIRHTLVLPMAAAVKLLGSSELATVLPTPLYYLALLSLGFFMLRRELDLATATLAIALLACTPLLAIHATIPGVDVAESFYGLLSLWLFHRAVSSPAPAKGLFLSGLAAGLALLTRETALGLLLFYALLFLRGACFRRSRYLFGAAGVAIPVLLEMAFFAWQAGDPLHRYHVNVERLSNKGGVAPSAIGNPVAEIFTNPELGLLFYLAIPAAIAVALRKDWTREQRRLLRLLMLLGAVTFFFVAFLANLRALPRYFITAAFVGVVLVATATRYLIWPRRRWAAVLLCAVLFGSNGLLILVSNRDPLFGERALADFAAGTDEVVYTDPSTLGRSRRFLRWRGVDPDERVRDDPAPPGALYFYHARGALKGRINWLSHFEVEDYVVKDGWKEVWSREPEERLAGSLLRLTGLDRRLPARLVERILHPNPSVSAWRVE